MEIIILALVLLAALPILLTVADEIGRAAERSTDSKPEYFHEREDK